MRLLPTASETAWFSSDQLDCLMLLRKLGLEFLPNPKWIHSDEDSLPSCWYWNLTHNKLNWTQTYRTKHELNIFHEYNEIVIFPFKRLFLWVIGGQCLLLLIIHFLLCWITFKSFSIKVFHLNFEYSVNCVSQKQDKLVVYRSF